MNGLCPGEIRAGAEQGKTVDAQPDEDRGGQEVEQPMA